MKIKTAELFTSLVIMLRVSSEHIMHTTYTYSERCRVYSQLDTGYWIYFDSASMPVHHIIYVFYVSKHWPARSCLLGKSKLNLFRLFLSFIDRSDPLHVNFLIKLHTKLFFQRTNTRWNNITEKPIESFWFCYLFFFSFSFLFSLFFSSENKVNKKMCVIKWRGVYTQTRNTYQ